MKPVLTNVTLIASDIAKLREFYADVLGLEVVFEEPGHIACMGVGPGITICAHDDSDEGLDGGDTSIRFACDDLDGIAQRARGSGVAGDLGRYQTGERRLDLRDPSGNRVRLGAADDYPLENWVKQFLRLARDLGVTKGRLTALVEEVDRAE